MEVTTLGVVIRLPTTGEPDTRPHFSQNFQVMIQAVHGDADFPCTIGRGAGALVIDEVFQPDRRVKE